jgi:glutathione-independent formaldehyde dehydrogenase
LRLGSLGKERLLHAKKIGFEPVDLGKHDRPGAELEGVPEFDSFIDAVGSRQRGMAAAESPVVLNQTMAFNRPAGLFGIPGHYVAEDPGALDETSKNGNLSLRFGQGWTKSQEFHIGQTHCGIIAA